MMDELNATNDTSLPDDEDAKSELIKSGEETLPEDSDAAAVSETVDYEALIAEDLDTLRAEFPELRGIKDITYLNNPLRYAALRDLGLTPEEAYMATAKRRAQDTRAHLKSAHGRNAAASMGMMSQPELTMARDIFPGLSDAELQRLYKRVTK